MLSVEWTEGVNRVGRYMAMDQDTAIISTIAVPEIMFEARRLVQATFMHSVSGQIYLICALFYLVLTLPLSQVAKRLEKARDRWR